MSDTVYTTGRSRVVHDSPACRGLVGKAVTVLEWDASRVASPKLCAFCYPQFQVASRRVRCCGSITRACAHNGGVLVKVSNRMVYVWPEHAHRHTLVKAVPFG